MRTLFSGSKIHTDQSESKSHIESQSGKIQTIGGHAENFSVHDGFLIKKTNRTEGRFYQQLIGHQFGLNNYVPRCVDVEYTPKDVKAKKSAQKYSKVTIEDLRIGFEKPVIYDIKLGIKTVSSKELRAAGSGLKEVFRKDLNLKVADKVTSSSRNGYRFVGSSASHDNRLFLGTHPGEMIEHMVAHLSQRDLSLVLTELEEILSYLVSKEGRRFEFIGASVLIIAETDSCASTDEHAAKPKVKLIDFAHSNVASSKALVLDNGVLLTPKRKRLYQKGLTYGLANLADDLRAALDNKQIIDEEMK